MRLICNDASTCPSGQTCVSHSCTAMVCGLTASNANNGGIYFPNMVPGSGFQQSADTTTVANTGNIIESPTISGANWVGSTWPGNSNAYMLVGSTAWTTTTWPAASYLTSTAVPIATLNPSGTTTAYYELSVPVNTPTDTYTQTITFSGGC